MRMRPAGGLVRAVQQAQGGGLARAGRADQRHGGARRRDEAQVLQGRRPAGVAERHALEPHLAARDFQRGLSGHVELAARLIEDREEILQRRCLQEQRRDEAGELFEPTDQRHRETDERDDLADADLALRVESRAEREDGDHRQRARGARGHREPGPAREHRVLGGERAFGQLADAGDLRSLRVEGLDDGHVAQHVVGALRDLVMQLLHVVLRAVRAAHRHGVERREADHQQQHQQRELPVHVPGERQHHDDGEQRRQVLAEEPEPDEEQVAAARLQDPHQSAGVVLAMECQRQRQRVLEEMRDDRQPAPVREAIGVQRRPHARDDADEAHGQPRADVVPHGLRLPRHHGVHDAAEEPRLQIEEPRDREIREQQHDGEPSLRSEQREHAQIDADHQRSSGTPISSVCR